MAKLKGKFKGTGTAAADATFEAETTGPAFDVAVRIEQVSVPAMNNLLRAYGRFDAAAGRFSFYSELSAKNGQITGYVKPLFKDVKIYASEQEAGKPVLQDVRRRRRRASPSCSRIARARRSRRRPEVSGRLDNPNVSAVAVVMRLVQNAFFKAILPGFDVEVARASRLKR